MSSAESIEALKQAIEGLHNCKAKYMDKSHVKEMFEGVLVWEGDVYLFGLEGHPAAKLVYAWSSPVKGSKKRKFYAILRVGAVKSAPDAVRASIAKEYGG